MEKITSQVKIEKTVFSKIQNKVNNILDLKKQIEKVLEKEITKILEVILSGAISLDASDIHIEPEEEKIKTRIRIDGILHDVIFIEYKTYRALLSRIKLLSGIKLNITKRAQDGRFTILIAEKEIEVRVSVLPSEYCESIVIRL